MVAFGVPYAMDGTVIPGVDLRWDTQRKVGVGSGVTDVGDLKVTPLSTPGAGFRVAAGGVLVQCRAAGRTRETYSLSNHTTQNYMGDGGAGLPGTGSGVTRSDLVILEILDSSFSKTYTPKAEWPVGQYAKISVVPGVPGATNSVDSVPALANVTAYALARIDYPASTATITAAMVKDLRQMQTPKRESRMLEFSLTGEQGDTPIPTQTAYPAGGTWPATVEAAWALVDVPEWATHVRAIMNWNGVYVPAGTADGFIWVQMGLTVDPDRKVTQAISWSNERRTPDRATGTLAIPESMRGRRVNFFPRACWNNRASAATLPRLTATSSIDMELEFTQRTV